MRSLMAGMIISMITMFFATWFLSSTILKTISKIKPSSSGNNESLEQKIKYGKDSMSHSKESPPISSYTRGTGRNYSRDGVVRFQKTSNPFGTKLNLRDNSNPFAPKLNLRRKHSWSHRPRRESIPQQKQYQKTDSSTSTKSSSPIISGYQNYVDLLNEQMKD